MNDSGNRMDPRKSTFDPFIAVLRRVPTDRLRPLIEVLLEAGLPTVEVTMDSESFDADMREALNAGAVVGAGTVRTVDDVHKAQSLGATFLASPVLEEEVAVVAHERGIRFLPGCLSPTEISRAISIGCSEVKVFPSCVFGPTGIRSLRGPFPQVGLVATGGIAVDEFAAYMAAGAKQVGIGIGTDATVDDLRPIADAIARWKTTGSWN